MNQLIKTTANNILRAFWFEQPTADSETRAELERIIHESYSQLLTPEQFKLKEVLEYLRQALLFMQSGTYPTDLIPHIQKILNTNN